MITTIDGDRDETELEKRTGTDTTPQSRTEWVEYWDGERLVHRSAHVHILNQLGIERQLGGTGG